MLLSGTEPELGEIANPPLQYLAVAVAAAYWSLCAVQGAVLSSLCLGVSGCWLGGAAQGVLPFQKLY